MRKVESKFWGTSLRLCEEPQGHLAIIDVLPGGYCSIHRHKNKNNLFLCQAGKLVVGEYGCGDQPTAIQLVHSISAFESIMIRAGTWHRFVALQSTLATEMYIPDSILNPFIYDDIERWDEGGVMQDADFPGFPCQRCGCAGNLQPCWFCVPRKSQ